VQSPSTNLEFQMIAFEVNDMTCGHCVSMITKAVKQADKDANVTVDLATKRVQIDSSSADETEFKEAIQEAGYTPMPFADSAMPASKTGGSCCGGCR